MYEILANLIKTLVEKESGENIEIKVEMGMFGNRPLGEVFTLSHKGEKNGKIVPLLRSHGLVFNGCEAKNGETIYFFVNPRLGD